MSDNVGATVRVHLQQENGDLVYRAVMVKLGDNYPEQVFYTPIEVPPHGKLPLTSLLSLSC